MKKQTVLKVISRFPSEFNLEELFERLIFIEKVEKGIAEARKGKTIKHIKLIERLNKKLLK